MSTTRRDFLATAAAAAGAALASSCGSPAAPYNLTVQGSGGGTPEGGTREPRAVATGTDPGAPPVPVALPSSMPMGSGAPLGGVGTGFLEIRADGCFYEWQIFNSGGWGRNARSTTAAPPRGAQWLRFLLRTVKDGVPQVRKLYLRSDENDLYTLPFVQDIGGIDYHAWFPMTGLNYHDETLPVKVSAALFSPFFPGDARASGTPGFHMVFTLENTSKDMAEVSLAGFLDNPLATALPAGERKLSNTLSSGQGTTGLLLKTEAQSDFPSGIGSMAFSVTGGEHSYITGMFQQYGPPGSVSWNTRRMNSMRINIVDELALKGRLPNSTATTDPGLTLLTNDQINALSATEVAAKIQELSKDAMLARVFNDAREADPASFESISKALLIEVRNNLAATGAANAAPRFTWGTGALASTVKLAPGQKVEVRFTLSWFMPHHLSTRGREMGHMYANWFSDAAEVNRYLCENYAAHRGMTESFARTLADTSLGDAMAFSWSSQLSTAVVNTWWTKDGGYAMWEGLGCCGLSTTDVDYQGSFPITALWPELKTSQMKRIIAHMNGVGQVPHNYAGDVDRVDNGFARVDMNPQFVMMACRDYLWTGDKAYLDFMWQYVVKAMAFTESLDTNGDGLPDKDTGLQTYDQWRMRGTPSYVASLWIGGLRAGIRLAAAAGKMEEERKWTELLVKASASFDRMLFNGEYYSLWVDGETRDELCMTDQISGEWFSHLIGLPTSISEEKLGNAVDAVMKHNFSPEFGLHNATAPRRGMGLLTMTNLQAGGVWSGIEFAFASFLMDHGRYEQGVKIVEAVHRRYLRAGQPWNHVECGGHYSRAMSSWATLLAATGFKPDVANRTLAVVPAVPGDFHAPWVTAAGFGTVRRAGRVLSLSCVRGALAFQTLRVPLAGGSPRVRVGSRAVGTRATVEGKVATLVFAEAVTLRAGELLTVE